MADTGWLIPSIETIYSIPGSDGNPWLRPRNLASDYNRATDSWGGPTSGSAPFHSEYLGWEWLVPANLYPSNAVVTGIEFGLWAYCYQHAWGEPTWPTAVISLQVGDATLLADPTSSSPFQLFRIGNPIDLPDPNQSPPLAEHFLGMGNSTSLFGLAPNTKVSDFFLQRKVVIGPNNAHTGLRCATNAPYQDSDQTDFYLSHAQVKIHYEVLATDIDLPDTEPETVVSATGELQVIHKLAALVVTDVLIEQAQLGNITRMAASPEINVGLPADLTSGTGFIDSTALPTIVVSIPDVELALIRTKDLSSSPDIEVSARFSGVGNKIDMSSDPGVDVSLIHGLKGVVSADAEPIVVVSLIANLSADTDMLADPKTYVTVNANLQGDINLGSECGEAELTVVVSLLADLGYAKGLYSDPNISVTLDGDGLVVGAALEFTPLVSVTIPFANLVSKFAEPAPDHRTVFKCPVDRTIRITRKDKTIL